MASRTCRPEAVVDRPGHGASEKEAIAALLTTSSRMAACGLEGIRERSAAGRRIVWACSDTDEVPEPPWQKRKQTYIDSLATKAEPVLLVSASDKLHNAQGDPRRLQARRALWELTSATPALWILPPGIDTDRAGMDRPGRATRAGADRTVELNGC